MKNRKLFLIGLAGVAGLALLLGFCLASLPDGKLHVFVLDVGQGDSILIQTPTSERILIDGGPDDAVVQELGKVMPFYEKNIDAVILSHPHLDHVNGLVEVLKRYHVGTVMMSGVKYNFSGYFAFLDQIAAQKIPVVYSGAKVARASDASMRVAAGSGGTDVPADYQLGSVTLDMLFPFESEQGRSFENQNNGSIVFRLLYGKRSFYFPGDLEKEGEEKLVASGLDLRADFLKAPHHGSKTSSTPALLDRIQPLFAAISCGVDNKFKHPFPGTLEHYQERKISIFRTDLDGIVEAVSDGDFLRVKALGK